MIIAKYITEYVNKFVNEKTSYFLAYGGLLVKYVDIDTFRSKVKYISLSLT